MEVGSSFMTNFAAGFLALTCLLLDRPDEAASFLPERLSDRIVTSDYPLVKAAVELPWPAKALPRPFTC
jgi:hypothetical protein